jgi:hypothetical protein
LAAPHLPLAVFKVSRFSHLWRVTKKHLPATCPFTFTSYRLHEEIAPLEGNTFPSNGDPLQHFNDAGAYPSGDIPSTVSSRAVAISLSGPPTLGFCSIGFMPPSIKELIRENILADLPVDLATPFEHAGM